MAALVYEQRLLQAKNRTFLEQGRAIYQQAMAQPEAPVHFVGRDYPNPATLKLQLELLFKEQQQRDEAVASAKALQLRPGGPG